MERPITNSLQAVRLAKERAINPTDWPQIIHLDEEDRPLPKNQGGGAAFIVVHRRAGDPTPTDEDIRTAQASADVASRLDRRLVDYIIIGTEAFYSFADERATSFRETKIAGRIVPVYRRK